ncbi:hypothetical protein NEOC95_000450 [Neochlamydia sp. AcF95]|nr:hypothetical protein [Neochlamydia sp. AcF95]
MLKKIFQLLPTDFAVFKTLAVHLTLLYAKKRLSIVNAFLSLIPQIKYFFEQLFKQAHT